MTRQRVAIALLAVAAILGLTGVIGPIELSHMGVDDWGLLAISLLLIGVALS